MYSGKWNHDCSHFYFESTWKKGWGLFLRDIIFLSSFIKTICFWSCKYDTTLLINFHFLWKKNFKISLTVHQLEINLFIMYLQLTLSLLLCMYIYYKRVCLCTWENYVVCISYTVVHKLIYHIKSCTFQPLKWSNTMDFYVSAAIT